MPAIGTYFAGRTLTDPNTLSSPEVPLLDGTTLLKASATGLGGGGGTDLTVKTISATSYTLLAEDSGKILYFTAATAVSVTAPNSLAEAWNAALVQGGAGQVVVDAYDPTALKHEQDPPHDATSAQWAMITLFVLENADDASAIYLLTGSSAAA